MADDIIAFGSGDNLDEASTDHDANLRALLQRCNTKGVKQNKDKVEIKKSAISLTRCLVTRDGLLPVQRLRQ